MHPFVPAAAPKSLPSWLPATLIMLGVALAYGNVLRAPFVFDDLSAVSTNATIHQFSTALHPPADGSPATGRPLLNLSYAVNYALGRNNVEGYRLINFFIHSAAALALFGLLRRTFANTVMPAAVKAQAGTLALLTALLWALHPLQTESVTVIAQRAESLCGLLYLLTLWCFARASDGPGPWLALSVVACVAGMASKEVMATAPLTVLLYDRAFVAGSFAAAWRQRRGYYLALAASWLLLGWLSFAGSGTRGVSAGLGLGLSWWSYLLTQCRAIMLYLGLSFWPHPLVLDRGADVVPGWTAVWWQGLAVLALLGGTGWALVRRPAWGFAGAWFFLILAPSSSFIPIVSQTIAEHRMYLSLAAVIAVIIVLLARWLAPRVVLAAALAAIAAAGVATHVHNRIYLDEQGLWEDVLRHYPRHARALNNLGRVHFRAGRIDAAIPLYQGAARLEPLNPHPPYNLGLAFLETGRLNEAAAAFAEAIRLMPAYTLAHFNLGVVLTKLDRAAEALPHFVTAIRLEPGRAGMNFEYGVALQRLGRFAEAGEVYARVLAADSDHVQARSNLGVVLFQQQAIDAAIQQFNVALRLDPSLVEVHFNLALALAAQGRVADALKHYEIAARLDPRHPGVQLNLGIALGQAGRLPEAITHLGEAVRLQPDSARAHANLAVALAENGRPQEALPHYERAAALEPKNPQAHCDLAYTLLVLRRPAEARAHLETALRLQPGFPPAQTMLREAFGVQPP